MKVGLIREGKVPPDKRVAFTPTQIVEMMQRFPQTQFCCQRSPARAYRDGEYEALGVEMTDDLLSCDVLMGIKEVPIDELISAKTYLFFSHTMKQQPYNRGLLQAVLDKKITLIDYEALKDRHGNRLVAFGRYAGIVGAYNALWTYGKRFKRFTLRRAFECFDINDLKRELRRVNLPPIKIVLTGSGRVGKGAMETLDTVGIRKVSPVEFLEGVFDEPVYVQLGSADYHIRSESGAFNRDEFYQYPERYNSRFTAFAEVADIFIGGAYWNPKAPVLFTRADMVNQRFAIKIVADITCDIGGSIPCTRQPSTIPDPIYDYDPSSDMVHPPFSNERWITVMAVDNLPCELPRSASEEFGRDLMDKIMKPLVLGDSDSILARATIATNGKLTEHFSYLQEYATH
jgi:alanine dehydrogenase